MSSSLRRGAIALASGLVVALQVALAAAAPVVHTVGQGDSLWTIARRYHVSQQEMASANGLRGDERMLHTGMRLVIPSPARAAASRGESRLLSVTADSTGMRQPVAALSRTPQLSESTPAPSVAAGDLAAPAIADSPRVVSDDDAATHASCAAPRATASAPTTAPATSRRARESALAVVRPAASARATVRPARSRTMSPVVSAATAAAPSAADRNGADSLVAPVAAQPSTAPKVSDEADLFGRKSDAAALGAISSRKPAGDGLMTALDCALKLVLVLVLAYISMLVLRKVTQRRVAVGKGVGLQVVGSIGLAPNRQLHIVALGDRSYLIASTPESVSLIADISDAQPAQAVASSGRAEPTDPVFTQRLREIMKAAPAQRLARATAAGSRLSQAARFVRARSNQMRPLGAIIDETLSA